MSKKDSAKATLNDLNGKEWVKATKSWFVVNPKPRSAGQANHPAKYPEELVSRFLRFFTKADAWVLDPFAGVGSTLVAAKELGRNAIGVELNGEYVEIGSRHLEKTKGSGRTYLIMGNAHGTLEHLGEIFKDSIPPFSLLMTSPPYWNMLRKSRGGNDSVQKEREASGFDTYYSDSEEDIGNLDDYAEYIDTIGEIFDRLEPILAKNAYLVIVVQNMRDIDGEMKPIAWDLARRLSKTYALRQEMIWCQDNKRLGCWGYPTTYVSNVHHHHCLILQKR
ncbi:MAG: site-specific DNA-methyltransferase [Candidatus Thorarchaeota archaeon]|nr:site-specific DNA-methyltransferase [Candidatus Thorarchaeota archaeon]